MSWRVLSRLLGGGAAATLLATGLVIGSPLATGIAHAGGSAAAFSTTDVGQGTGACEAPPRSTSDPDPVNCNQYAVPTDVWMNGGPAGANLAPGTYFFAVVDPGGHGDPNDGSPDLLSSDSYTNREFTVDGTGIHYSGTHLFDQANGKIQLSTFALSKNGVYQMVICAVPSNPTTGVGGPGVTASDCKSDNFKVDQGSNPNGGATAPTVTKTASGTYTDTFTWGISKSVDNPSITSSAGSATFNYTVTVTHDAGTPSKITVSGAIDVSDLNFLSDMVTVSPITLTGVSDQLVDSLGNPVAGTSCTVDTSGSQTVDVFGTPTQASTLTLTATDNYFPYSCTMSSLFQGELDNMATATWGDQTLSNGTALPGGSANFTFQDVTFTPTLVDDCVTVSDSDPSTVLPAQVCQTDPSPTTFMYPVTVTGTPGTCVTHNDTANFLTDTTMTSQTPPASQQVSLCTPEDLQVVKTANPTYTRTYNWSIQKMALQTKIDSSGSTATANYSVAVNETGFVDSNIVVKGTITVTNPNDFEAITLTGVQDNGPNCAIDAGQNTTATIPANTASQVNSVAFTYTCSYTTLPANFTNTATATWSQSTAKTPDGSADSPGVPVAFGAPTNPVNKTVTPTDAFNGGTGVKLCTLTTTVTPCTLTAADGTPLTSQTYNYSRSVAVVPNTCVVYPNTASLPETGQTSPASVTVCGPLQGALTMGFWHNSNGQAIITKSGPSSGTCALTTWLRNFLPGPFQDLSATATCAQVAAYQLKIFNAATCSGTCNAMLKSQMLATALDVYFSDPALGGNKIGAPAPIGGALIDLTNVPGAGNVSASFGGATSMTVSQMLNYAASQSNSDGSTWYGNNKTLETGAQVAFNDINNDIAFI